MADATVLLEQAGAVGTITLNRPDKLNAMNRAMLGDLHQVLDAAEKNPDIRALVLKGAGRAFSVGMDVEGERTPAEMGVAADRERLQEWLGLFLRVWDFPKPIVAEVHGYCCAAATMLALACDITLVGKACKIRFPSIPIGGGFVSTFWTCFVGPKRAKEMDYIAGSEITGEEASAWGWANHAWDESELSARATRMATLISRTPADLLRIKKLAINRVAEGQGFRHAVLAGAEWDTLCHFTEGATDMRNRIASMGLRQAIESLRADSPDIDQPRSD